MYTIQKMKKIISFDIGIRNMSYCIFSLDNDISVLDWKVVNLLTPPVQQFCSCTISPKQPKKTKKAVTKEPKKKPTKKGSNLLMLQFFMSPPASVNNAETETENTIIETSVSVDTPSTEKCGKVALYAHPNSAEYFCLKHAKEHPTCVIPSVATAMKTIKKKTLEQLTELCATYKIPIVEKPTKKYLTAILQQKLDSVLLNKIDEHKKSANDTDLISIGRNMIEEFSKIPDLDAFTHVIIENQISTIATRMKALQGMVSTFFMMKCPGAHIEYISSVNKLKDFVQTPLRQTTKKATEAPSGVPTEENVVLSPSATATQIQKAKYKQHKQDSIAICSSFIENNTFLGDRWKHVVTEKKSDDYSDSFLQCLWYMKHNNWIVVDKGTFVIRVI